MSTRISRRGSAERTTRFESFGRDRTVRSTLLFWLCRDKDLGKRLAGHRIEIRAARFEGRLNLSYLDVPAPLTCIDCWLPDGLELVTTKVVDLILDASWVGPLSTSALQAEDRPTAMLAEGLRAVGIVSLRNGLHAAGEINLIGAEIGGDLTFSGAVIDDSGGRALVLDRATVRGNVHLRGGFAASGMVRLVGTKIGGDLDSSSGSFTNPGGTALALDGATIDGSLLLHSNEHRLFEATGLVRLVGARIGRGCDASGAVLNANRAGENIGVALLANAATIGGSLTLGAKFHATGEVRLIGAAIGESLDCARGHFTRPGGYALNAESARIGQSVFLGVSYREIQAGWSVARNGRGFEADGEVRLFGSTIGGNLIGHAAQIRNAGGVALNLERARVSGAVLARYEFDAKGELRLFGAVIGGDLECRNASFRNPGKAAIRIDRTQIGGAAELCANFRAEGDVVFDDSVIGRDLDLAGADLARGGGSLLLCGTEIKGTLRITELRLDEAGRIDLTDTSCAVLADDAASWPGPGRLVLEGFVYRRLAVPGTARSRLAWLERQLPARPSDRPGHFRPFPYRHAAAVLRAQGLTEDARDVLIGMAVARRKWGGLACTSRAWQFVLWALIRNGYRPIYALVPLAVWWVVGFLAFGAGYQAHVIWPLDKAASEVLAANNRVPDHYEPFCALAYAVDSSLPIVSLGQRDKWHVALPDAVAASTARNPRDEFYEFICRARFLQGAIDPAPSEPAALLATALGAFRWVYVAVGWFLTTMLVAGVAGLVGRD